MITYERVRELFDYKNGDLVWKQHHGLHGITGKIAGNRQVSGDLRIGVDGQTYEGRRLIWLWHYKWYPVYALTHINRLRSDTRIENMKPSKKEKIPSLIFM